jgi:hypothetical protein
MEKEIPNGKKERDPVTARLLKRLENPRFMSPKRQERLIAQLQAVAAQEENDKKA